MLARARSIEAAQGLPGHRCAQLPRLRHRAAASPRTTRILFRSFYLAPSQELRCHLTNSGRRFLRQDQHMLTWLGALPCQTAVM